MVPMLHWQVQQNTPTQSSHLAQSLDAVRARGRAAGLEVWSLTCISKHGAVWTSWECRAAQQGEHMLWIWGQLCRGYTSIYWVDDKAFYATMCTSAYTWKCKKEQDPTTISSLFSLFLSLIHKYNVLWLYSPPLFTMASFFLSSWTSSPSPGS